MASTGFTLIETLAGVGIFLIVLVSIMSLFGVAIDTHKTQVDRQTAALVAERAFAHVRAYPPSDTMPPVSTPVPTTWASWYARPAAPSPPSPILIPKEATSITLDPNLRRSPLLNLVRKPEGALAVAAERGMFWIPSPGRPAFALIEDAQDPDKNEWITFEVFQESLPTLQQCTRGQLGTRPEDHGFGAKIVPTFYFPDYPKYSFRLSARSYTMDLPPANPFPLPSGDEDISFDLLDVTVLWSEVNRAREATFSFALSDRTQFDHSATQGVFRDRWH